MLHQHPPQQGIVGRQDGRFRQRLQPGAQVRQGDGPGRHGAGGGEQHIAALLPGEVQQVEERPLVQPRLACVLDHQTAAGKILGHAGRREGRRGPELRVRPLLPHRGEMALAAPRLAHDHRPVGGPVGPLIDQRHGSRIGGRDEKVFPRQGGPQGKVKGELAAGHCASGPAPGRRLDRCGHRRLDGRRRRLRQRHLPHTLSCAGVEPRG